MQVKETYTQHYSTDKRHIQYIIVRYDLKIACPYQLLLLYIWLVKFLSFMCEGSELHSYTGKLRVPKKPQPAGYEPPKGHRACQHHKSDSINRGTHTVVNARIHTVRV